MSEKNVSMKTMNKNSMFFHQNKQQGSFHSTSPSSSSSSNGHHNHNSSCSKPARIRTVLNEKQLQMLRACYGANPRPDALMKEQLVEMTGLSPRVIRVWFQNKRCKDKKKSIMIKQMQEQQKVRNLVKRIYYFFAKTNFFCVSFVFPVVHFYLHSFLV